ncbi:cytochrome P450 [Xylona heveae TC161]|uniref:Cytochrome P450 n=1 Tax=Xylona heveae (strain CBS 132557 / TC161) TaxID=1328760 RepID=A0A165JYA6_XYLHT|nr:cytochrome P450 [Xylona heveae TC161]KZF26778.1 cytochrome P450 [Xylona heveae TC161]
MEIDVEPATMGAGSITHKMDGQLGAIPLIPSSASIDSAGLNWLKYAIGPPQVDSTSPCRFSYIVIMDSQLWLDVFSNFRYAVGVFLLLSLFLWKLVKIFSNDNQSKKRSFKSWLSGYSYIISAPEILQSGFEKAGKRPYTISTPEHDQVMLSSEKDVAELLAVSEEILSLHAAANDLFRPKYTMGGFELHDNPKDNEPNIHLRVIRVILPSYFPILQPILEQKIRDTFAHELISKAGTEWKSMKAFSGIKRIVAAVNSVLFVGEPLASNPTFVDAALQFPNDAFTTAEVIRMLPAVLSAPISALMTRRSAAIKTMRNFLFPLVEERISKYPRDTDAAEKPLDCVQWLIDSIPKDRPWPTEKIVAKICALWFGSVHQLAMTLTFALYDLGTYPEYVDPLRKELEMHNTESELSSLKERWRAFDRLPVLDSFLKESARLHPSDCISVRRKALTPHMFTSGTHIPEGAWACVPQAALQKDPSYYANPETFDAFRFVSARGDSGDTHTRTSNFTDVALPFPFWGMGKRACPGRYHAAWVLKLVLAHVVLNYDMKFSDDRASRSFKWRSAIVPRSDTTLLFKARGPDAPGTLEV